MEKVKIIQVRPIYREGNKVMDIRIQFPRTRIKPGDFITLGEGNGIRLTWDEWVSKYIKKTMAESGLVVKKQIDEIVEERLKATIQFPLGEDKL